MTLSSTSNASVSPAELHKGSGLAVEKSQSRWYIAECKPTKERVIRTMLKNAEYEVYVASQAKERIYASRNRRMTETVVIPGKVFVRTDENKLMGIMLGYSSVHRFMLNRAHKDRTYAFVPDDQMQQLQYVLGQAENPVFFTTEDLQVGQQIRVMRGPLAGLKGWFHEKGHISYIVIKMEMGTSHYIFTEVPLEDIQPL